MRNNLAYFRAHLKESLRPTFFFTIVAVVICTFILQTNSVVRWETFGNIRHYRGLRADAMLQPLGVVLCALCYIVAYLQFSGFKKRRNLDCFYALPITRRALGVIHYLVGLFQVLVPFTGAYLISLFLFCIRAIEYVAPVLGSLILWYLLCLLLLCIMYSFLVFAFNVANTSLDGCVFMLLYTFVFAPITAWLVWVADKQEILSSTLDVGAINSFLFGPLVTLTNICVNFAWNGGDVSAVTRNERGDVAAVVWLVFWIVVGILSFLGFFFSFGKRRTEKTEETSDSYFGYRILIPFMAFSTTFWMFQWASNMEIWFYLGIDVLALMMYTLYRRGFHYKKSDFIVIGLLLLLLII